MSRLPTLPGRLGERMAAGFGWLAGQARANLSPYDLGSLEALLSETDIANYIFIRTGIAKRLPGGRLSDEDIAQGRDLPEAVRSFIQEEERGISRPYPYDRLWELHYAEALETARRSGSDFLKCYLPWESQLRNVLAELRCRAANLDPGHHLVRTGGGGYGFGRMIAELQDQANPLDAMLYLDRQRLRFIAERMNYDGFSLDALLGYLARARIYDQWQDYTLTYDLQTITQAGGIK
jgi:hypothetical protein